MVQSGNLANASGRSVGPCRLCASQRMERNSKNGKMTGKNDFVFLFVIIFIALHALFGACIGRVG